MPTTSTVYPLDNTIRDYAWGSADVIPELLGIPRTGAPMAELWLGAHPSASSRVVGEPDGPTLADRIAADPHRHLGDGVIGRFGASLPFLLKVLAAQRNLSLQAHPSLEQARQGYAREDAAGVALDDPARNYRDANHKPEQVCALTEFAGLCGFRPVVGTVAFLDALGPDVLDGYGSRLLAEGGLRDVVTALLTLPERNVAALVAGLKSAAGRLARAGGAWAAEASWLVWLAEAYPGDRGVVLAVLLNLVVLAPGESMFLRAGQIHTYLRGTAIEVLANGDNVLRGGLSAKHVDVPELMRVLDVTEGPVVPVAPSEVAAGRFEYPSEVPDFVLTRLEGTGTGTGAGFPAGRPRILLVTRGTARLDTGRGTLELGRGGSAFVGAADPVTVSAEPGTTVFVASTRP